MGSSYDSFLIELKQELGLGTIDLRCCLFLYFECDAFLQFRLSLSRSSKHVANTDVSDGNTEKEYFPEFPVEIAVSSRRGVIREDQVQTPSTPRKVAPDRSRRYADRERRQRALN
jgi:hypothetical protein